MFYVVAEGLVRYYPVQALRARRVLRTADQAPV